MRLEQKHSGRNLHTNVHFKKVVFGGMHSWHCDLEKILEQWAIVQDAARTRWEIPWCKVRCMIANPLLLLIHSYGDFPLKSLSVPCQTTFPVSHLSGWVSQRQSGRWLPESAKAEQVLCCSQPTKAMFSVSAMGSRKGLLFLKKPQAMPNTLPVKSLDTP